LSRRAPNAMSSRMRRTGPSAFGQPLPGFADDVHRRPVSGRWPRSSSRRPAGIPLSRSRRGWTGADRRPELPLERPATLRPLGDGSPEELPPSGDRVGDPRTSGGPESYSVRNWENHPTLPLPIDPPDDNKEPTAIRGRSRGSPWVSRGSPRGVSLKFEALTRSLLSLTGQGGWAADRPSEGSVWCRLRVGHRQFPVGVRVPSRLGTASSAMGAAAVFARPGRPHKMAY
jgi:hypothetical protein